MARLRYVSVLIDSYCKLDIQLSCDDLRKRGLSTAEAVSVVRGRVLLDWEQ